MTQTAEAPRLSACGGIDRLWQHGASHARQMAALPDLYLAAACDVDGERAREAAAGRRPAARAYTDVAELLAQPDIPAVLVATPNFTHRDLVLQALAAGKDVFCEKPMALTVADCDAMIEAAQRQGRKLMVGQVLRLMTVYATVPPPGRGRPDRRAEVIRVLRCSARRARPGRPGVLRATWRGHGN